MRNPDCPSCSVAARAAILPLLLVPVALPAHAFALPVDGSIDAIVGEAQFVKLADLKAAATDQPKIATAEIMQTGELLITPKSAGRALLFLADSMRTAAWRLRVRERGGRFEEVAPSDEARASAKKACPGLQEETHSEGTGLSTTVVNAACRRALKRLLDADPYRARFMDLTFTPEALQDQLADIEERLKADGLPGVRVHYEGMTLVVEGSVGPAPAPDAAVRAPTPQTWTQLARAFYEAAVGRVPADFRFPDTTETKP